MIHRKFDSFERVPVSTIPMESKKVTESAVYRAWNPASHSGPTPISDMSNFWKTYALNAEFGIREFLRSRVPECVERSIEPSGNETPNSPDDGCMFVRNFLSRTAR